MRERDYGEGAKVLVVDDEPGVRDMLKFVLTDRGYRVTCAATGEEALKLAGSQRFDAVICDIRMPGLDGVETLKVFKSRSPRTEVIMVTGYATAASAKECEKLGARHYIAKPYDIEELCAALRAAVEPPKGKSG